MLTNYASQFSKGHPKTSRLLQSINSNTFGQVDRMTHSQLSHLLKQKSIIGSDSCLHDKILNIAKSMRQNIGGMELFHDAAQAAKVEIQRQQQAHDLFFNLGIKAKEWNVTFSQKATNDISERSAYDVVCKQLHAPHANKTHFHLGDTRIIVKHNPTQMQPLNSWVLHVGTYSDRNKKDIVTTLLDFMTLTDCPEDSLVEKFEFHRMYGTSFSLDEFRLNKKHAPVINKMNRILYLVNVQEILRSFNKQVPNANLSWRSFYPASFAVHNMLYLLKSEKITISDAFHSTSKFSPISTRQKTHPTQLAETFARVAHVNSAYKALNFSDSIKELTSNQNKSNLTTDNIVLFTEGYLKQLHKAHMFYTSNSLVSQISAQEKNLYEGDMPCSPS